jgi:hypothetical protein
LHVRRHGGASLGALSQREKTLSLIRIRVKNIKLRREGGNLQLGITDFSKVFMASDLMSMGNDEFDNWLRDISGRTSEDHLTEDRLVELVSATLREIEPGARARGFVDLANLSYAMADKALGCQSSLTDCLEIVVSVNQRH